MVHALTLDRSLEDTLRSSLGANEGEVALAPDLDTARRLIAALETLASRMVTSGQSVVLLSPPDLRRPLHDFASRFVPELWVVTARELVPGTTIEPAGVVQIALPVAA